MKIQIIPVIVTADHDTETLHGIMVSFNQTLAQLMITDLEWITEQMQLTIIAVMATKYPKTETFNVTCQAIRNHNFNVLQLIRNDYFNRIQRSARN